MGLPAFVEELDRVAELVDDVADLQGGQGHYHVDDDVYICD